MVDKGIRLHLGRRDGVRVRFSRVWLYLLMTALAAVMTLPLIYAVGTAFKPLDELLRFPPIFFVRRPTMDNFGDLFLALGSSEVPFLRYLFNSLLVTAAATAGTIVVSTMGGYAMSKLTIPGSSVLFTLVIIAMTFPGSVTTIPVYMLIRYLGLYNSYAALILPGLANGYSIFLLKGFFDSLPKELYESAMLDGAGEVRIFFQFTMSLSKPILAVTALGAFTGAYGNFMMALLVCQDRKMWTLMPWLYQLQMNSGPGIVFASLLVAAIPTFLVFLCCQNVIMRGIVVPVEK